MQLDGLRMHMAEHMVRGVAYRPRD